MLFAQLAIEYINTSHYQVCQYQSFPTSNSTADISATRKAFFNSMRKFSILRFPNSPITQLRRFSSSSPLCSFAYVCSCLMIEIGYGFFIYHPVCVCIRGFYFIAPNLLFKQEKRFENLWNCVLPERMIFFSFCLRWRWGWQEEKKEKIIADKFSLLETILIGFFIMLVLWRETMLFFK